LERTNRTTERLTFTAVADGLFECRFCGSHSANCNCKAFARQLFHQITKALSLFTKEVITRHAHIVKEQFSGILRVQSNLFQASAALVARHITFDDQRTDPLMPGFRAGFRRCDHQVVEDAVGDEGLLAVQEVNIAIA
jgi:hypothetical protein